MGRDLGFWIDNAPFTMQPHMQSPDSPPHLKQIRPYLNLPTHENRMLAEKITFNGNILNDGQLTVSSETQETGDRHAQQPSFKQLFKAMTVLGDPLSYHSLW